MWRYRYGAAVVLATMFLLSWIGQFYTGWVDFLNTQHDHNVAAYMSDYMWEFGSKTLENWQSEFLQVLAAAWVFKRFFWKGSPESKEIDNGEQEAE